MNIEKRRKKIREYDSKPENKLKKKIYMAKYRLEYEQKNKEKISKRKKKYYKQNKKRIDERNKKWHERNKNLFKNYLIKYYSDEKNIDRRRENSKRWHSKRDKQKYNLKKNIWYKNKVDKDLNFKIKRLLRSRVTNAFNYFTSSGKIMKSKKYGIDYSKIIKYLIKILPDDFEKGKYEIDHIKACCLFDFSKPEDIKKCFSPENHQWLTKEEHFKKTLEDIKKSKLLSYQSNLPNPSK